MHKQIKFCFPNIGLSLTAIQWLTSLKDLYAADSTYIDFYTKWQQTIAWKQTSREPWSDAASQNGNWNGKISNVGRGNTGGYLAPLHSTALQTCHQYYIVYLFLQSSQDHSNMRLLWHVMGTHSNTVAVTCRRYTQKYSVTCTTNLALHTSINIHQHSLDSVKSPSWLFSAQRSGFWAQ